MKKIITVLLLLLISNCFTAQKIRLHGNIADTGNNVSVRNALLMAIRFADSSLVKFTRTDNRGFFKSISVPLDTYIVIISHPSFSDKTYLLVPSEKDTAFHFKNVVMPPKSIELKEVEIFAYRDKSYYKGDTLIFTADSFKTRPNATVEDLLKKLPGFRVDAAGKITVQGKEVDQVLVDGDEFFGSDPTAATRNLNATSIANVQVYEKKAEVTEDGKNETLKVLNLQMKDDAKKGYFGKVSGASDFMKFYEGELLVNNFKKTRKVSTFALVGNTPKQFFDERDADKFGLSGEQGWQYNQETGGWSNNRENGTGIPRSLKGGFYFNDKISKKTKINTDYTYNNNELLQGSETNTQFFLVDTSYSNSRVKSSSNRTESHNFNFTITQKLDSLTELTFSPKIRYSIGDNRSEQTDEFFTEENVKTRSTLLSNKTKSENVSATGQVRIFKTFMKKDRVFSFNYLPSYNSNASNTLLNTDFKYFLTDLPDSSLVQQRKLNNERSEHNLSGSYTEPITKKFRANVNYTFIKNQIHSSRNTFDFRDSTYDIFNPTLSNNFQNKRMINRAGMRLIYDVKKFTFAVGTAFRNTHQENFNLSSGKKLEQDVNNILPNAFFNYRISQGSNFSVNYNSSSALPDLQQMQPVVDNSDPNNLSLGNPDLQPSFKNEISGHYYFYKAITDINLWSNFSLQNTQREFSSSTVYDSLGRAITKPINVDGNYFAQLSMSGGFPLFKKFLKVYPGINGSISNQVSYINNQKNLTEYSTMGPSLQLSKDGENFYVNVRGEYNYTVPKSTISVQSIQPYYTYNLSSQVNVKFAKRYFISTDGEYTNNGNRTPGYNLNYFIWNASAGRSFLKTENLVVSLNAFDILNQNINNQRTVNSNQIIDSKTQIIRRYFLLRVLYKFNNNKTKIEDDDY